MSNNPVPSTPDLSMTTKVLVVIVAAIGFLFDTYELLMLPIIGRDALSDLLQVPGNNPAVREWAGIMLFVPAFCGGIFGLLGGFLIDRYGRKRIMILSILLYSVSPLAAAFSTSVEMLLVLRCLTFIGICVEFVAAITWLAELFEDERTRKLVLGWTQAFASVGGLVVTGANVLTEEYATRFPIIPVADPFDGHAYWRYTLLTGLIPGILILLLMPFVPESRVWMQRKRAGTLRRPKLGELFQPALRRTTLVASALAACAYAGAFGAIQLTPIQIAPGLPSVSEQQKALVPLRAEAGKLNAQYDATEPGSPERAEVLKQIKANLGKQKPYNGPIVDLTNKAQAYQEFGGLVGRILLAIFVVIILNSRNLLRLFVIPGLIFFPLTYYYFFRQEPDLFFFGVFMCGLFTVAQFSFFGEYLPKAFPLHLRGTGGSFAINVGGRMIGTSASLVTTIIVAPMLDIANPFTKVATAAAIVVGGAFFISLVLTFFLPTPKDEL